MLMKRLSGGELALLHMRILQFGRGSLADTCRLGPEGPPLTLAAAAQALVHHRGSALHSYRDGERLGVTSEEVREVEALAHVAWVSRVVEDYKAKYGTSGAK